MWSLKPSHKEIKKALWQVCSACFLWQATDVHLLLSIQHLKIAVDMLNTASVAGTISSLTVNLAFANSFTSFGWKPFLLMWLAFYTDEFHAQNTKYTWSWDDHRETTMSKQSLVANDNWCVLTSTTNYWNALDFLRSFDWGQRSQF